MQTKPVTIAEATDFPPEHPPETVGEWVAGVAVGFAMLGWGVLSWLPVELSWSSTADLVAA